jgi:hypothetical protein
MLRERFGIYTDATCPAGTTRDLASAPLNSVLICIAEFGVKSAGQCLAGGTPMYITDASRNSAVVCIPSTTASYPLITTGGPQDFPCRSGDYLSFSDAGIKCIPSGSASTTTTTTTTTPSSGDLNAQYETLKRQYDTLVAQTLAEPARLSTTLPQIQSINQQMSTLLDQMLTQLQYARNGPNSDAYRDQLAETLARIQMDYNGLKTNTDALQTLRRIRSFQDTSWQSSLNLYLALFLIFAIVLVLVMLFRRQTKASTPAPSASPAAIPTLM